MSKKDMLLRLNKMLPKPSHPFNMQLSGKMRYVDWQFKEGHRSIEFYKSFSSPEEMFSNKVVLDIGCGAGGKTMYYGSFAPSKLYGADIVSHYKDESESFAKEKGMEGIFTFLLGDAKNLPLENGSVDTVIMNDAMEHVADPEGVLDEIQRILKPGGRLYVNFPPYNHPYGAHLKDMISIPWVHVFFSDKTLIEAYKELVSPLPDADMRINFRIGLNEKGEEYFSYLNKMTIKRFLKIKENVKLKPVYYSEAPLRPLFTPLARLPFFKEYFVKMVVTIFENS